MVGIPEKALNFAHTRNTDAAGAIDRRPRRELDLEAVDQRREAGRSLLIRD